MMERIDDRLLTIGGREQASLRHKIGLVSLCDSGHPATSLKFSSICISIPG